MAMATSTQRCRGTTGLADGRIPVTGAGTVELLRSDLNASVPPELHLESLIHAHQGGLAVEVALGRIFIHVDAGFIGDLARASHRQGGIVPHGEIFPLAIKNKAVSEGGWFHWKHPRRTQMKSVSTDVRHMTIGSIGVESPKSDGGIVQTEMMQAV